MPKVSVVTIPADALEVQNNPITVKSVTKKRFLSWWLFKLRSISAIVINKEFLLTSLLAFLLGRVAIINEMSPFGIAFFAALAELVGRRAIVSGIWALVGVLSAGRFVEAGVYLFVLVCYLVLSNKITVRQFRIKTIPVLIFAAVFVGKMAVGFFHSFNLYLIIMSLIEASMCLILSYMFTYGMPVFVKTKTKHVYSNEMLACALLVISIAIAGVGKILFYEYSLRNIIGSLFIMMVALNGGVGLGTSVGVAVGLVIGLNEGNPSLMVCIYSIAGLIAGIFHELGRYAVIPGYLLGCIITVLYFGQAGELTLMFIEVAVASLLFAVVPGRYFAQWKNQLSYGKDVCIQNERICDGAANKVKNIAEMFQDLSETFSTALTGLKMQNDREELSQLLTRVGENVCESCANRDICWDKEFYRTYQAVVDMFGKAKQSKLTAAGMTEPLKTACTRPTEVVEAVRSVAQSVECNQFWHKKVIESRQIISEQMKAMANILGNVVQEIKYESPTDRQMAAALKEKAAILECPLKEVTVTGTKGSLTVNIYKHPCQGTKECKHTILPLAANLMHEKLMLRAECGNDKKDCMLSLTVARHFIIKTGMASVCKECDVSGDTCAVVPVNQGRIALMLSDGMGTGRKAKGESSTTVRFLERLLATGFDVKLAVKTVNSMLLLKTPEESFATMDMAVIDTYSGETEFLKVGAAPSFVKRVGEVWNINSASLPIGIMDQIEIEPIKWTLTSGDILIMVSDGVADIGKKSSDRDGWLVNFLRRISSNDPQIIAEEILKQAKNICKQNIKDDMTVLVAKVIEQEQII